MEKFYKISFRVGLNGKEEFWESGYINNSSCGPLNTFVVKKHGKKFQVLNYYVSKSKKTDDTEGPILSREEFLETYSKIFDIPIWNLDWVLLLTVDHKNIDKPRDEYEATYFIRRGDMFAGEINLEKIEITPDDVNEFSIVAFLTVEINDLDSGKYKDDEESAGFCLPD